MQKNNHFLITKTNHIDIFSIGLLILFATNKFILKLYHNHELFFLSPLLSHRFNLKSTNKLPIKNVSNVYHSFTYQQLIFISPYMTVLNS